MKTLLARSLSRKQIMSSDGKIVGTLKNIMIDFSTGEITDIILEPEPGFDTAGFQVEDGRMFIPFESVRDIKDYIVVDRYLMKK